MERLDSDDGWPLLSMDSLQSVLNPPVKYKALAAYVAVQDDELSFDAGDILCIVSRDSRDSHEDGWWIGHLPFQSDQLHIIPASLLSPLHASAIALPRIPKCELILSDTCIGQGAFGEVFRGVWHGRAVALKRFSLDVSQERCEHEASLLWLCHHPNLVQVFGLVSGAEPNEKLQLVMEYAAGGSLHRLLASLRLSPETILSWALQIAKGMHYLHHTLHINHCDLKSSNILVREEVAVGEDLSKKTVLISDLGLASMQHMGGNMASSNVAPIGTFAWTAPEILSGGSAFTPAADVWSFGVVLWELLTGAVPYQNFEQHQIHYNVARGYLRLPIPNSCPSQLRDTLERCWQERASDRPTFETLLTQLLSVNLNQFSDLTADSFYSVQEDWQLEICNAFEEFRRKEEDLTRQLTEYRVLLQEADRRRAFAEYQLQERHMESLMKDLQIATLQVQVSNLQPPKRVRKRPRVRIGRGMPHISLPQDVHHVIHADLEPPAEGCNRVQVRAERLPVASTNGLSGASTWGPSSRDRLVKERRHLTRDSLWTSSAPNLRKQVSYDADEPLSQSLLTAAFSQRTECCGSELAKALVNMAMPLCVPALRRDVRRACLQPDMQPEVMNSRKTTQSQDTDTPSSPRGAYLMARQDGMLGTWSGASVNRRRPQLHASATLPENCLDSSGRHVRWGFHQSPSAATQSSSSNFIHPLPSAYTADSSIDSSHL